MAEELLQAIRDGVDGDRGWESAVSEPAYALGILRAQQGRNVAGVVEDVLRLRLLVWGEVAARSDASGDVAELLLLHQHLCAMLDVALRCAVDAYVDESTRVLAVLVSRDGLTGLWNRAGFSDALDVGLRAVSVQRPLAVALLDLDGFKAVNDTLGHSAGDDLLQAVARVLEDVIPRAAAAARLGGDEFAVFLPDCPPARATQVMDRLVRAVRDEPLLSRPGTPVRVSVGVAFAQSARLAAELLAEADGAMYAAKRAGGDRWHAADQALPSSLAVASAGSAVTLMPRRRRAR